MRKVPAGTFSIYDSDVWEVLKTPDHGDPYLIATYPNETLSRWCLGTMHTSLEVASGGKVVI